MRIPRFRSRPNKITLRSGARSLDFQQGFMVFVMHSKFWTALLPFPPLLFSSMINALPSFFPLWIAMSLEECFHLYLVENFRHIEYSWISTTGGGIFLIVFFPDHIQELKKNCSHMLWKQVFLKNFFQILNKHHK